MSFPEILFTLNANNQQLFHLEAGSLKQRIVQLLGNNYNAKLVAVKEDTDYMNIYGFVGKPETAKKTRVTNTFCQQPFYQKPLPEPCGDECIPGNDSKGQFPDVCIIHRP